MPVVSMFRHVRLIAAREIIAAMEARSAAAWPHMANSDRDRWITDANSALAEYAPPAPREEDQIADPVVRAHVRRIVDAGRRRAAMDRKANR